jgi:hypothetical protein
VFGACLLLLGALGVAALGTSCGDQAPDAGSGHEPGLILTGLPDDMLETLTVTVTWREAGQTAPVRKDAEPLPGSPGSFLLPPAAYGRKVEIDVLKEDVIILRKKLELAGDSTLRIDLAKEPAYRETGR